MLKILHASSLCDLEILRKRLAKLQKKGTLFPGEPLKKWRQNFYLTFDHAYFRFYHKIFPLLKEYKVKALLGVTTHYILEKSSLPYEERLAIAPSLAMQEGIFETKAPFCTWEELREMVDSGYVEVAAHSHLYCNLTFPFVDLAREVVKPKELLEMHLPQKVGTFFYPFGRYNSTVQDYVKQHYSYAFCLRTKI